MVPVSPSSLDGISHIRVALPNRLKSPDNRDTAYKMILDVQNRFYNRIPLIDPIRNMKISDPRFQDLVQVSTVHPLGSYVNIHRTVLENICAGSKTHGSSTQSKP